MLPTKRDNEQRRAMAQTTEKKLRKDDSGLLKIENKAKEIAFFMKLSFCFIKLDNNIETIGNTMVVRGKYQC